MKLLKAFWNGFVGAFTLAYVICVLPFAYCLSLLQDKITKFWQFIADLKTRWNTRKK